MLKKRLTESNIFDLPIGTVLKPKKLYKTSNYTDLTRLVAVELVSKYNHGGSGGSYGAKLAKVKILEINPGSFITKKEPYSYSTTQYKVGDLIHINGQHFELALRPDEYPIFF